MRQIHKRESCLDFSCWMLGFAGLPSLLGCLAAWLHLLLLLGCLAAVLHLLLLLGCLAAVLRGQNDELLFGCLAARTKWIGVALRTSGSHRLRSCLNSMDPAIQFSIAARSTAPFVMPSAIMSLVSSHTKARMMPLSRSSLTNCTWDSSDFSDGALILSAVIAAKTDMASIANSMCTVL